jgi:hypothetical protein
MFQVEGYRKVTESTNPGKAYKTIEQSVLATMIAKYPTCFVSIDKVPIPLKIGVARDIITNELSLYDKPDNKKFMEIRGNIISFLEWYENRRVYLNAIINNSMRIDLFGNTVEVISEQQKEYAKCKLLAQKSFNRDWNDISFKASIEDKKEIFEILDFLLNSKFIKTEYRYPNVIPYYDQIRIIKGKLLFPETYNRFDRYRCFKWIYTLSARRSCASIDKKYFITGRVIGRLYAIKWIQTVYININELREKSKHDYNCWAKMPLWSYQEFLLLAFGIDPNFKDDFINLVRVRFKTKIILEYERLFKITYREFNNSLSDGTYPLPLDGTKEAKQKRIWLSKTEQSPQALLKFALEKGYVTPEVEKMYELASKAGYIDCGSSKNFSQEISEMEEFSWNFESYSGVPDLKLYELVALSCNINPEALMFSNIDGSIFVKDFLKRETFNNRLGVALRCLGKTLKCKKIITEQDRMIWSFVYPQIQPYNSEIEVKEFLRWAIEDVKWANLHPKFLELGGCFSKTPEVQNNLNEECIIREHFKSIGKKGNEKKSADSKKAKDEAEALYWLRKNDNTLLKKERSDLAVSYFLSDELKKLDFEYEQSYIYKKWIPDFK